MKHRVSSISLVWVMIYAALLCLAPIPFIPTIIMQVHKSRFGICANLARNPHNTEADCRRLRRSKGGNLGNFRPF